MKGCYRKPLLSLASLLVGAGVAAANMLQNASFEQEGSWGPNSAMNWKMNDPDDHGDAWGSAAREQWRAQEGKSAGTIRGTWAESGNYGGWWQEAEIQGGKKYRFSAYFSADAAWTAETQEIKMEFWTIDRGTLLGAVTYTLTGIGEEWAQRSVDGLAPENSGWARIVISAGNVGPAGSLLIDNVVLEELP